MFEKPAGNCITVSYELNSILITINRKGRKATLSFRGRKEHEFVIRELLDGQFAVDIVLGEPVQLAHMKMFLISHITDISKFITSLISHYNPGYLFPTIKILRQDERFVQACRKAKRDTDSKYKLILEKRVPKIKGRNSDLLFSSF